MKDLIAIVLLCAVFLAVTNYKDDSEPSNVTVVRSVHAYGDCLGNQDKSKVCASVAPSAITANGKVKPTFTFVITVPKPSFDW